MWPCLLSESYPLTQTCFHIFWWIKFLLATQSSSWECVEHGEQGWESVWAEFPVHGRVFQRRMALWLLKGQERDGMDDSFEGSSCTQLSGAVSSTKGAKRMNCGAYPSGGLEEGRCLLSSVWDSHRALMNVHTPSCGDQKGWLILSRKY